MKSQRFRAVVARAKAILLFLPSDCEGTLEFGLVGPHHSMGVDRAIETFEPEFPDVLKTELLTDTQLGYHV